MDVGYQDTKVAVILPEGHTDINSFQFAPTGTSCIEEFFMSEYNISRSFAENVIAQACFCRNTKSKGTAADFRMKITSGREIVIKAEHRNLFNVFFDGENSIQSMIQNVLQQASKCILADLKMNICIIGGGANILGLKSSLKSALPESYRIIMPNCNPNFASWLGGSLFSSIKQNIDKFALLRGAYIKYSYPAASEINVNEISEGDLRKITKDTHDNDELFEPVATVLPDIFKTKLELTPTTDDSMYLAQVIEAKRNLNVLTRSVRNESSRKSSSILENLKSNIANRTADDQKTRSARQAEVLNKLKMARSLAQK